MNELRPAYDAVILAGGRARRLGGVDKAALSVGGQSLLDRVTSAVAGADRVIVVGPQRPGTRADVVIREDPPGGGPVAALAAGLACVTAGVVVVLAADLPFLRSVHVDALRAALMPGDGPGHAPGHDVGHAPGHDVVVAVDEGGRDQILLAAWRTAALRTALTAVGDPVGVPVRVLFRGADGSAADGLAVGRLRLPAVRGGAPPWFDCDTGDDLRTAERWA